MKRNNAWTLAAVVLVLAFLTGCPWSPDPGIKIDDDDGKYVPQSSPANVLQNLKTAYEERNIDQYLKLFGSDFKFVFNPDDANDPLDPTPTEWGFAEERTSTENMFTNDKVESIQLDLTQQGEPEPVDSVAYGPRAWRVRVEEANLRVNTRNETNEPLTYLVPGTLELFFFREDPTVRASDGRSTWYIFRWEDQPIGGKFTPVAASPGKPDA